jgi:hypothetical protein
MTKSLALMLCHTTVKCSPTLVATIEHPGPTLHQNSAIFSFVPRKTLCLFSTVAAQDLLFHATAVAARRQSHIARPTEALVAQGIMLVLATRHHIATDLTATPATHVVCLRTSLCYLVLSTKANLRGSHVSARWTRTGMTSELARVWTFPRTLLTACLTARVGRDTSWCTRLEFFLTPAHIAFR